jgi:hypothetical protein
MLFETIDERQTAQAFLKENPFPHPCASVLWSIQMQALEAGSDSKAVMGGLRRLAPLVLKTEQALEWLNASNPLQRCWQALLTERKRRLP